MNNTRPLLNNVFFGMAIVTLRNRTPSGCGSCVLGRGVGGVCCFLVLLETMNKTRSPPQPPFLFHATENLELSNACVENGVRDGVGRGGDVDGVGWG
jgi:hypothetical protein